MKRTWINLILLNILFIIMATVVHFPLPFDIWRKGPPIHAYSAYSSGNAEVFFWIATAVFLDLYVLLILFSSYVIKKREIGLPKKAYVIIVISILATSVLITEYVTRVMIKNSSGYTQFRPHPLLYWYNRKGLKDFKSYSNRVPLSTNSHGFRYKEDIPVEKPDGEYRIFVFGDSSAFGNDVKDHEAFSDQLENMLNQGGIDYRFRVINAACPGHTTYQGLILLKKTVLKFDPDLIVIAYNNDPGLEYMEEKARGVKNPFLQSLNLLFYSSDYYLLFRRVMTDIKLFVSTRVGSKYAPPEFVRRVSLEDYSSNIKEFIKTAEIYGIRVLFVKMPVNFHAFEAVPYLKEFFYDERYRDILTEVCRESDSLLVDINKRWPTAPGQGFFILEEYGDKKLEAHFHPSPKGHRDIAEQIYKVLRMYIKGLSPLSEK